ncbi:unnamed protein product [Miscanthus lutarioriparius]|uniref:Uncharacterized protein n=1 Tax=Miscanthus lutarioriparius TaxID=422564 RepID=A0A811P770_9POAL|nr:unnamed protein product [Miscanthus lutarioriparius]
MAGKSGNGDDRRKGMFFFSLTAMQTTQEDGRLRLLPWKRGRPERGVPRGAGTARGGALKKGSEEGLHIRSGEQAGAEHERLGMRSTTAPGSRHQLRIKETATRLACSVVLLGCSASSRFVQSGLASDGPWTISKPKNNFQF